MDSPVEDIKKETLKKWGERVVAIALFGSYIKKEEYNDIDVLIVLEDINEGRVERIGEIVELKRSTGLPLDITLISREECLENFTNHNPLYLDIATESNILYDTGFLKGLIDETKSYIEDKNIKKIRSRWLFPVKDRAASALSKVTNMDWAKYWIEDGKRDLKAAKYLFNAKIFERSVYHCQQAVEKADKGILMCFGIFEKTHYVSAILKAENENRDLGPWNEKLKDIVKISENLEPHISLTRYPGISGGNVWLPYKEYNSEVAEKSLKDAGKVIKSAEEFVRWWFKEE